MQDSEGMETAIMDLLFIAVAVVFGFITRQCGLPPLVGFLLAGFALNAVGMTPSDQLLIVADLGITLMLFTIGLKLDLRNLLRVEVWGVAFVHNASWILLMLAVMPIATLAGLYLTTEIDWQTIALVAFALSFSSTVCVVKMLEEACELKVRHGRLAIAILIIQDIIAVVFLVLATGKTPSIYAIGLLALGFLPFVLSPIIKAAGHGELLPLIGILLALGGSQLFELVNIKGDLGALIVGILLARHAKASELYRSLIGFKDLFLLGFFLSIGFIALPSLEMLPLVLLFSVLLIAKFILFFGLFLFFRLSGRSAFLTALALSNFSEFGLIVANVGVSSAWLSGEWLVVIALAMSVSFAINSLLYRQAHRLYARYNHHINRLERVGSHNAMELPDRIDVLILGMGRVGKGAYHALSSEYPELQVYGLDADSRCINRLTKQGFRMLRGYADDYEFWQVISRRQISLVMMALPGHQDTVIAIEMMKLAGFEGNIATVARYADDRKALKSLGIDTVFDYYAEVGAGFAAETRHLLPSR